MRKARVLLVDDHELFRAGFRALLASYPDFEVVGEAADARTAYLEDERLKPDLTVMDVRLPGTDGISATRELRRRDPVRPVVILSALDMADVCIDAMQAGASGYLLKTQPVAEAVDGMRQIVSGETYLSPSMAPIVEEQRRKMARREDGARSFDLLSAREKEVFRLLIRGKSNSTVAKELCISVKTVESHREHILKKLGLHSV